VPERGTTSVTGTLASISGSIVVLLVKKPANVLFEDLAHLNLSLVGVVLETSFQIRIDADLKTIILYGRHNCLSSGLKVRKVVITALYGRDGNGSGGHGQLCGCRGPGTRLGKSTPVKVAVRGESFDLLLDPGGKDLQALGVGERGDALGVKAVSAAAPHDEATDGSVLINDLNLLEQYVR
jgi:hypothetical protein